MNADDLRRRAAAVKWYHTLDLGQGVVTQGWEDTPIRLARLDLPQSCEGLTVLDVGAWDGFFSFEVERRGAARVVAADHYAWHGPTWSTKAGFNLAREALQTDLIKLEVIGDQTTLFPDNEQTLDAARILVKEGFVVLPYFNDDLIMAKKLMDAGCAGIMPLAAPIGSGLGVQNPANLRIMREQLPDATIIVDAGVGTASDAAIAMELGADGVLMNTAIAEAVDPAKMGAAMKLAIQAGRLAYQAGRMPKRLYASASSPMEGVVSPTR